MTLIQKLFFAALPVLIVNLSSSAQTTGKKTTTRPLLWLGYTNTLQLSSKWSLTSDIGERRYIDNGHQSQFLIRSKVNYSLGQNWDAGIGFAYFQNTTSDPLSTSTLAVPELRPFEEFNYKQKFNRFAFSHRFRVEERYFRKTANDQLVDGYNFNFRFRYQLGFDCNLYTSKGKSQALSFKAADEVMVNAGKNIVSNMFDQNRLYLGFNYQPINNLSFEFGYMNLFQEKSSGTQFNQGNIIRFSVFQKIKLYK